MTMTNIDIEKNLQEQSIELPKPVKALAAYEPVVVSGNEVVVSGQLPLQNGALLATGLVGLDIDIDSAQQVAECCAKNVLGQVREALGNLNRVKRLKKITVFVASNGSFTDQHVVANGASLFFKKALLGAGEHARSAIGVSALPLNAPVEVEAIFEIE